MLDYSTIITKANQPEIKVALDFNYRVYEYQGNDGEMHLGVDPRSTLRAYLVGNEDGTVLPIPSGKTQTQKTRALLTGLADWIYFHEEWREESESETKKEKSNWSNFLYPGLHSNKSIEELAGVDYYLAKQVIVFRNFKGTKYGIPFLSSEGKAIAWAETTVSGSSWKTQALRFAGNQNHNDRLMNKHYMMNYLLSGKVIECELKDIGGGYLQDVINTYANESKSDAFKVYRKKKNDRGAVETDIEIGKKLQDKNEKIKEINNNNTNDGSEQVTLDSVQVRINGGDVEVVKFEDLEKLSYRVVTPSGADRPVLVYTGSKLQQARLFSIAKKGEVLVATK